MMEKTREEMIEFISKAIEHTHNDKDKRDLLEFSNDELIEVYNDIIEDNK